MRTSELMQRTGVTRRALRLYEAKGLIAPAREAANGYRWYDRATVERLHAIGLLKSIGCTLGDIARLIGGDTTEWSRTLLLQEHILKERKRAAEDGLRKVRAALDALAAGEPAPEDNLLEVIAADGQPGEKAMKEILETYYSEAAQAKLAAHSASEEERRTAEAAWQHVIADAERLAQSGADPASDEAQALIKRWDALIAAFTLGDPEIEAGLKKLYADGDKKPSGFRRPYSDAVDAFIAAARAAGTT